VACGKCSKNCNHLDSKEQHENRGCGSKPPCPVCGGESYSVEGKEVKALAKEDLKELVQHPFYWMCSEENCDVGFFTKDEEQLFFLQDLDFRKKEEVSKAKRVKEVTPVILAGGASSRMGENKALMKIDETPIIQWMVCTLESVFEEPVHIITNHPEEYPFLENVIFVKDVIQVEGKNSLVGLYSGLLNIPTDYGFFLPCDMPFVNGEIIEYMTKNLDGEEIYIPYYDGHYQPLHGIYHKNCIEPIRELLEQGQYKLIAFHEQMNLKTISKEEIQQFDKNLESFININQRIEYEEAKKNQRRKRYGNYGERGKN